MQESLYSTWSTDEERDKVFASAVNGMKNTQPVIRSLAFDTFKDVRPHTSIRDNFSREHYEYFRSKEAIPRGDKEIMATCGAVYERVGLIQNIINLMSDFTVQGIRIRHERPRVQKFWDEWSRWVNFAERSERISNMLYRLGNAPIMEATAKLKPSQLKKFYQGMSAADLEVEPSPELSNREIPCRYTIVDPTSLEVSGGELALFTRNLKYSIKVDDRLISRIKNPQSELDKELASQVPQYIKDLFKKGAKEIPIPDDKISVLFFKKDDSQVWARPITYSILSDIFLLEKMKLADLAALDGAISHIRIWKLGSIDHKIWPNQAIIDHLHNQLLSNVGGGVMDLIWGPDLQLDETSTEVQKFLGSEKYESCLGRIYAGMGVPETLSGKSTAGGFTNNFISMKTLTERLNYGRIILNSFWEKQINKIHKVMGFSGTSFIVYDRMTLSDEAAERALVLQMVDRDLISVETAQELFGQIPELETGRINKEYRMRSGDKLPHKAGPWHNPQQENKYLEMLLQQGLVTPSQLGIELEEPLPNEKKMIDIQNEQKLKETKMKGRPGEGRPINKKDSQKRKQKRVLPRTSAFMTTLAWANEAQKELASQLNEVYLKIVKSKNLRTLTNAQFDELETFKFGAYLKLPPFSEVTPEVIRDVLSDSVGISAEANTLKSNLLSQLKQNTGKQATIEDIRNIQAVVYTYLNTNLDEDISS